MAEARKSGTVDAGGGGVEGSAGGGSSGAAGGGGRDDRDATKLDDAKRFEALAAIMRASHFEWRRAVLALCPELDPMALVKRYWEEVARDTARYYLRKIDPQRDLAAQVAELFVSSSVVMGEDAAVIERSPEGHSQARHASCPWFDWHRREGLLAEDQVGCDHFLQTVVDAINAALGTSLRFATDEALPAGEACCRRRFWVEEEAP